MNEERAKEITKRVLKERKKSLCTRKKLKIVGKQEYLNTSSGEIEEFQVLKIEDRDFNFHKLWLHHILDTIDLIGNKKVRLAFWIIEHLNRDNQLIATQKKIEEIYNKGKTNPRDKISKDTITATIKHLVATKFLLKLSGGAYAVNPDFIFKGGKTDRLNVLLKYRAAAYEKEQEDLAERIKKNGESMQEPMQNNEEEDSEKEDTANNEA